MHTLLTNCECAKCQRDRFEARVYLVLVLTLGAILSCLGWWCGHS